MRTSTSGSITNGFSHDEYIEGLILGYCKRFGCTYSSFIRLGVELAAKRLSNKEKEKGLKIIRNGL